MEQFELDRMVDDGCPHAEYVSPNDPDACPHYWVRGEGWCLYCGAPEPSPPPYRPYF
jgi:hypothetical protein